MSPLSELDSARLETRRRRIGPNKSKVQTSTVACDRCRQKKIKCDGTPSCSNCVSHHARCHYSSTVRRYRGSSKAKTQQLQEKLENAERLLRSAGIIEQPENPSLVPMQDCSGLDSLVRAANLPSESSHLITYPGTNAVLNSNSNSNQHQGPQTCGQVGESLIPLSSSVASTTWVPGQNPDSDLLYLRSTAINGGSGSNVEQSMPLINASSGAEHYTSLCLQRDNHTSHRSSTSTDATVVSSHSQDAGDNDADSEVLPKHDEFHGPDSYLSICHDPGMSWIASHMGISSFKSSAISLMSEINGKLLIDGHLSNTRTPEPSSEVAWEYTKAYFEESLEATYYIIDRRVFELRLKNQLDNPSSFNGDDSWYALRNIVFASGCRLLAFKSHGWAEAQRRSMGYFKNALSVETSLLHGTVGFNSIQALVAMALYAEGLGSPKLEHMLISCALRMAHTRGFHLQPTSSKIPFEDAQRRTWIFWTIYCLEKQLALRSGRPSHIDDDDISCELPKWAPDANPNIVEYFKYVVHQAKISSSIMKTFMTVKARKQPLAEKAEMVKQLDQSLRAWYEDLPGIFKPDFPIKQSDLPNGIRTEQLMQLHFAYFANLAAIHSIFGYPWNLTASQNEGNITLSEQAVSSTQALSKVSRKIVLATRYITIDAYAPAWLVFHYPLIGMINLFVSVLNTPAAESTAQDIGLIDMAGGYFAYLEYAIESSLPFSFIRNIPQWTREIASKTSAGKDGEPQSSKPITDPETLSSTSYDSNISTTVSDFTLAGLDFGDWPAFLPLFPHVVS